jgi:hypothetical protein
MSIGVYEYFSRFKSSFYYIPIGKNKIENVGTSEDIPLNYRVNLYEYLTLYGLRANYNEELIYNSIHTKNLFNQFKNKNFNRYKISNIMNAQTLLNEKDKRYYSGVWFEEYVYQRIKEEQELSNDAIWRSVKLYRANSGYKNDNEIDVIFVKDNELFVCECKMSLKGEPMAKEIDLIERYMYKLAAISKDFGLKVNPYIVTLHNLDKFSTERKQSIEKRMKVLGIKGLLGSEHFKQLKLNI